MIHQDVKHFEILLISRKLVNDSRNKKCTGVSHTVISLLYHLMTRFDTVSK